MLGPEANDVAIKLTWYYHHATGRPGKTKVIGRRMGYHGSTIAAVSASGKADMHADFNLPLPMFRHTDTPHYYRGHEEGESEETYSDRLAANLERLILEEGPETVGAFIAEPAMGAAGAISPPRGYFERIRAILDRYEVLLTRISHQLPAAAANSLAVAGRTPESHFDGEARSEG